MLKKFVLLLLLMLVSCNIQPTPNETQSSPQPAHGFDTLALGYYTGTQASYDSIMAYASYLDIVSVDVYGLNFEGDVVGEDPFDVVGENRLDTIDYYACISNWNSDPQVENFDPNLARVAILDHREEVISQLVSLVQKSGYAGVNIDLEEIHFSEDIEQDRADFVSFIAELASQLHAIDKKLIISVAAKETDDPENTWSYPYDLEALGREADYLQLMTYDQHGSWGGPGSVSGVEWVESCVAYTSSIVDPAKLLIGLPAYGYDWDLSEYDQQSGTYATASFSWVEVPTLIEKPGALTFWDPTSQSPSLTYTENSHEHIAWYENSESLRAKVELISRYDLAGLSVWALGMEDQQFWQAATSGNSQ